MSFKVSALAFDVLFVAPVCFSGGHGFSVYAGGVAFLYITH